MIKNLQSSLFKYPQCQGGELHEGEALNLVCVDENCEHRGIICPVCKMDSHEGHHVMAVKIFMGQIRDMITTSNDSGELNNLSDYLRSLESTKKELKSLLRDQITELSAIFKDLELKLESTYLSIRRNVLIQSTLSNKMPTLLEQLVSSSHPDSFNMQRQFGKYCELIKYKDGKARVTDKASVLVQNYLDTPSRLKIVMESGLSEYKKQLQSVNQNMEVEEIVKPGKTAGVAEGFTFSSSNKNKTVSLNQEQNQAWLQHGSGYIFLQQAFSETHNKVSVQIIEMSSKIMLGAGHAFALGTEAQSDYEEKSKVELFVSSNGVDCTSFEGGVVDDDRFFCFKAGDKITITADFEQNTCRFTTDQDPDKILELHFLTMVKDSTSIKLCVGLNDQSRVRIVKP